jgi:rhodanese-related sulfurtransferase
MEDILARFPGSRRALFASFHIGGCQSCAYRDEETLAEVCKHNEISAEEATSCILESHRHDLEMLLTPLALQEKLAAGDLILCDLRTREEHEAVVIPGSEFLSEERQNELFALPPETEIALYDHSGRDVLDRCSWFRGHGLKNTYALQGGIDAWSKEVDPNLPRYRLELE